MQGRDLAVTLALDEAQGPRWGLATGLGVALQLANALHFLHSGEAVSGACILHRDIKPANVI